MWNPYLFLTTEQIREYDRIAIEEVGMPSPVLMENAGRGAAEIAHRMCPLPGRIGVLAGPGNNGGDGFVIARHLANMGHEVTVYLAVPRDSIHGDAALNLHLLEQMHPALLDASTADQLADVQEQLFGCDLIVDALLGTGISREIDGHMARLIEAANICGRPVLAIDVPSGLDANTGRAAGLSVRATATATFGHLKRGLVLFPGAELAGEIHVIPLGVPGFVSLRAGVDGEVTSDDKARSLLPARPRDGHKGTFGHLLAIAGSRGKTGAAAMLGIAALRSGAGLVTLATTSDARTALEAQCLEVMVEEFAESATLAGHERVTERIEALLEGKRALALGPGLGTALGIGKLVGHLLDACTVPMVIDADGLNVAAGEPSIFRRAHAPLVLTPHPGEMARLLGTTVAEVQADRIGKAREAALAFRAVVLLKGAHTVIAAPDGELFVNPTGNSGMGSGGMGDVLSGVIGALLAQGLSPLDAALLGAYVHGMAGDEAAKRRGNTGLVASDVIDALPAVFCRWSA